MNLIFNSLQRITQNVGSSQLLPYLKREIKSAELRLRC